jgi:RNA polymerase sigma factor (sigma-70 family)
MTDFPRRRVIMANGSIPLAVRRLNTLMGRQALRGISDLELLQRVVEERDEAAFELLVWRHERMVRGVCWRVLRNRSDVEDACQATFLTLACKAGSIGKRQAVGSWLYRVAFRIALRAKADAGRRGRHEKEAGAQRAYSLSRDFTEKDSLIDLGSIVDEEVSRLPEKYRTPIILCYLEGKTNEEAASQLGCPTGTVVTWLARARHRLRTRLARRGVGITAGALAAVLAKPEIGTATAPAFLQATLNAALLFTHDKTIAGPVSTRVALLTKGALHAMLMDKVKIVAAIIMSLGLVGAGSSVLAYRTLVDDTKAKALDIAPAQNKVKDLAAAVVLPKPDDEAVAEDEKPDPKKDKEKSKEKAKKDGRAKVEEVLNESYKTGKAPSVSVDVFNGAIEIVADAENAVKARVTKQVQDETEEKAKEGLKQIDVKMTQDKEVIHITARHPQNKDWHGQASASAEVHVPAGSVLDLHTSNGQVKITGGAGKVTVHTSNGAIKVKDNKGALHLTTSNGAIGVAGATGPIELETTNGPITLQAEKAVVKAHGTNGEIAFSGTLADGAHLLTTNNGRILLTLPADARFKVDASTSNGSISSDFTAGASLKSEKKHLLATVGENPAAAVQLRTSNGAIEIRKKK